MLKPGLIYLFILLNSLWAFAQTPEEYTQKLKEANSPAEFRQTINYMVDDMWAGKLNIDSKAVQDILTITHTKPFANDVLPTVYGWLGTVFGNGQIDQALFYFLENASTLEKKGKHLEYAVVCFEIALIQHKAKNFVEAEKYYERALAFGKDSLDHRTRIGCSNGLALIYRENLHYREALTKFRDALVLAHTKNDRIWVGILNGNIGSIHFRQGRYDSSEYYYLENLKYVRNTRETENIVETYINLGRNFLHTKQYKNAKVYLDSAIYILDSRNIKLTDFFNPSDDIYETYALLYAELKDYSKAYDYYNRFYKVVQEKQIQVNGKRLAQLQSAHEFKQKQTHFELLEEINQANKKVIRQQQYVQIAFITIIIALTGFVLFALRVSQQRKRLNVKLNAANIELERLNETKNKLFSVISHDLRGPISNLEAILKLVNTGSLTSEEFTLLVNKIQVQVQSTGNIMNSLLQWARTEISGSNFKPQRIPADFVKTVADQFQADLHKKGITVVFSLSANLHLVADRDQLEIILRNLISNAIKFSHREGTINISAAASGNFTAISISDNGIGMSETEIHNLFKPGKHISRPGTQNEIGTGIGLFITHEMIGRNGGTIHIESGNNGTTFTVKFPAKSISN